MISKTSLTLNLKKNSFHTRMTSEYCVIVILIYVQRTWTVKIMEWISNLIQFCRLIEVINPSDTTYLWGGIYILRNRWLEWTCIFIISITAWILAWSKWEIKYTGALILILIAYWTIGNMSVLVLFLGNEMEVKTVLQASYLQINFVLRFNG